MGNTPLHLACQHLSEDTIENMIEFYEDVNARNVHGETALHVSIQRKLDRVVECLLKKNADVQVKTKAGELPLQLALAREQWDIVKLLLDYGDYTVRGRIYFQRELLQVMLSKGWVETVDKMLDIEGKSQEYKIRIYQELGVLESILHCSRPQSEILDIVKNLFRKGYRLTHEDIKFLESQLIISAPIINNVIWDYIAETEKENWIRKGFIDKNMEILSYFCLYPQKVSDKYLWETFIRDVCVDPSYMTLLFIKSIFLYFQRLGDRSSHVMAEEKWFHEKIAHFAFEGYFAQNTEEKTVLEDTGAPVRAFLFRKGVWPKKFIHIHSFFKFWIRSLLERKGNFIDQGNLFCSVCRGSRCSL